MLDRVSTYLGLKAKHTQNCRSRYFDIYSVAMILELQIAHFVDEETFKSGVEKGGRFQPLEIPGQLVTIDQETGKEQTVRQESV